MEINRKYLTTTLHLIAIILNLFFALPSYASPNPINIDQQTILTNLHNYFAGEELALPKKVSGHCCGLSSFWLYAKWLQQEPAIKNEIRDDHDKFANTMRLIASHSDKSELIAKELDECRRFFSIIKYLQKNQGNLELAKDHRILGLNGKIPTKEFSIASTFDLEQLREFLTAPTLIKPGKLILVLSHKHTSALFRAKDNVLFYYDPNNPQGEEQVTSLNLLADLIYQNHFGENPGSSTTYYQKQIPLGILIFSFEPTISNYPAQKDILKKLDAKYPQNNQTEKLSIAASSGCVASLQYALAQGADIHKCNGLGIPVLINAARYGSIAAVQMLLQNGADPNQTDNDGTTPLMQATENGNIECMKILFDHGANPNKTNNIGGTALMFAAKHHYPDCISLLAKKGATLNQSLPGGYSALTYASEYGCTDCIKRLVEYGANVNQDTDDGWTPLMFTAQMGHYESMKTLLLSGADPNKTHLPTGNSALALASYYGHYSCVKELLDNGANPNQKNRNGITPLMFAAHQRHAHCMKVLLDHGASAAEKDYDHLNARYYAQLSGCTECLVILDNHKK